MFWQKNWQQTDNKIRGGGGSPFPDPNILISVSPRIKFSTMGERFQDYNLESHFTKSGNISFSNLHNVTDVQALSFETKSGNISFSNIVCGLPRWMRTLWNQVREHQLFPTCPPTGGNGQGDLWNQVREHHLFQLKELAPEMRHLCFETKSGNISFSNTPVSKDNDFQLLWNQVREHQLFQLEDGQGQGFPKLWNQVREHQLFQRRQSNIQLNSTLWNQVREHQLFQPQICWFSIVYE